MPEETVTGLTLNKSSITLTIGTIKQLEVTITPNNATNKTVTWNSSNESVAKVNNGMVTAVGLGTVTITAQCGDFSAKCEITVLYLKKGDVTLNDEIDIYDILDIQRQILGTSELTEKALIAADVNGNGEVDIYDILAIQRYILGVETIE